MIAEIARLAVEKGGHVMFMVHRRELINQIEETFRNDDIDLTHTTIMTVTRIKNRLGKLPTPTLIITDESHHSLAKTYKDIYKYYSNVPRLGFTATPWRMSGAGLGEIYDDMVEGPDVKWLIDHHYLADYTYYSANEIDKTKLKKSSNGDYTKESIDDSFASVIYGDIIKNYREYADGKQAIVYAYSVEFSKKVVQEFNDAGISAVHADATTNSNERDQIMADFKNDKFKILSNVDLVGEGFNVPDVSVIILLRPTKSLVVYLQQSMRGMRYKPGKHSMIIDHVANVFEHGLPDEKREWSLKGHKKKHQKNEVSVHECPFCHAVFEDWLNGKCPMCGQPKPEAKGKKGKDYKPEVKLRKITSVGVLASRNPYKAKSLVETWEILDAQKRVRHRGKYPVQRSIHIWISKKGFISATDLKDLAAESGWTHNAVSLSYQRAMHSQPHYNIQL